VSGSGAPGCSSGKGWLLGAGWVAGALGVAVVAPGSQLQDVHLPPVDERHVSAAGSGQSGETPARPNFRPAHPAHTGLAVHKGPCFRSHLDHARPDKQDNTGNTRFVDEVESLTPQRVPSGAPGTRTLNLRIKSPSGCVPGTVTVCRTVPVDTCTAGSGIPPGVAACHPLPELSITPGAHAATTMDRRTGPAAPATGVLMGLCRSPSSDRLRYPKFNIA
jgi:hypothetical protein